MPDALVFVFGILGLLAQLAVIGLIIYGVVVWRRRAAEHVSNDDTHPGIGTIRRLYFYFVAFVSLMMAASGIVLLIQFILDSVAGSDVISDSNTRLAAGASLLIVGAPLWYFHWRYIQRTVAEQPVETRSFLRKIYIYITLAVAGSIVIYTAYDLLNWISRAEDFNGYSIAAVIIWSVVWAFHWLIEEREGQATPEIIAIRRLYIYIASLAGLVMLSLGAGRVIYFILLEGYNAATPASLLAGETGLWRHPLREMLSAAIVGAVTWALHWLYIARRDYGSALRQVYLYIFAILGGVLTTLSALGIIIHEFLTWAFGAYSAATVAQHFEFLPGSVAALSVGAALWAYHWHKVRQEADASAGATLSARRVYTYILVTIGTGALAIAVFMLISAFLRLVVAGFGDVVIDDNLWKRPLINIITLAVLGGPIWGYYWQNIQHRLQSDSVDEITATSRRIFLFFALGVGVLALLGSVSALLFFFLRDLLEASLSLDTLNDLTTPVAVITAAATFLPYYWAVYRDDQGAASESEAPSSADSSATVRPELAEGRSPRKQVTLLAAAGSPAMQQIQAAIGCEVSVLRWADADAATLTLTDEDCAQLAQSIADAPGDHVLLVPDGELLRVLSHD